MAAAPRRLPAGRSHDGIRTSARLRKRFVAACGRILARGDVPPCVMWSAALGAKRLGGKDLFVELSRGFELDPFAWAHAGYQLSEIYDVLDDARAMPLLLAAWRKGETDERATDGHPTPNGRGSAAPPRT